jgi:hypothetical protein
LKSSSVICLEKLKETGKPQSEELVGLPENEPTVLPTRPLNSIRSVSVVLYGCETWSLTLREGHRLRVFEDRVLKRIFGPKRDEVTGGWRKLHNEELHNLYFPPQV